MFSSKSTVLVLKNCIKFPLHFLQLFSGAKSFEKNTLLGSRFLNEHNLHVYRVKLSMYLAGMRRRRLAPHVPEHLVADYERDGVIVIEKFLDDDHFQSLMSEVNETNFDRVDMYQGETTTRRSMIDDSDLESRPALMKARDSKRLMNLVRYVASHAGQPLVTLQTVLAKASGNQDPQSDLHSDTFHATAKAWLFLNDVEEDDGPFCFVKGSHNMTEQRLAWEKSISTSIDSVDNKYSRRGSMRVSLDQLSDMGYPQPTKMVVKANTLVVANTQGFHARCSSQKNTTRMEIYVSLRRNPFLPFVAAPFRGLHFAALPLIKARVNRLAISSLTQIEKLGIKPSPWNSIGYGKSNEWRHPD